MDFIYRQFQDPDRPVQVTYAVLLLYAYLAIAVLVSTVQTIARIVLDPEQALQLAAIMMVSAMSYLFMFFVAWMVAKGRSWARSLLILGFAFTLLTSLFDMRAMLAGDLANAVLSLGQLSVTAVAIALLFQKPSSDWYRSISESKSRRLEPEAREVQKQEIAKEPLTAAAGRGGWQGLSIGRRITWALRSLLFLGIVLTLFLPWYPEGGAGWQIGLAFAYLSCGLGLSPYLALLVFGLWSVLQPAGRVIWAYRLALLAWIAYSGMIAAIYDGPIVFVIVPLVAATIEIADVLLVVRKPKGPAAILAEGQQ